jgi:hypothetical protein
MLNLFGMSERWAEARNNARARQLDAARRSTKVGVAALASAKKI